MDKLISEQAAIDALHGYFDGMLETDTWSPCDVYGLIEILPPAQPEQHEIGYSECANAMLKMWIDNVLTDGEYNRIMDKLNAHWAERREG